MPPKKRKQWTEENMKRAIMAVRNKNMGLGRASIYFEVPKSTLKDKVNSGDNDLNKLVSTKLGRKPVLDSELEQSLVKYCLDMEARFYGLTAKDVKKMAFHLAEKNSVRHPFNEGNAKAGWKWLHSFMRRHPELSLRKPQLTSMKRIRGFSRENVKQFFDIYEPLLEMINHDPKRLYNCDETGITIVQHKTTKVIALKGKRQVGAVSSAERGSLVTVVTCMSATGHFIPPLLVFPRTNQKPELLDGAPNGSRAAYHKSGWIESETFLTWFQEQFLDSVKPTKEDPVILVLDGHYSHTRNLPLLESAKENGVHIVSLPPHCSHKMQPLDRAFMYPLKTYYGQEVEKWLKQHVGRVVTHFQVAKLFAEAYKKSATVATAEHGFRVTGLYPLDRDVFKDHEFAVVDSDQQGDPEDSVCPSPTEISPIRQEQSEPQPGPSGLQPPVNQSDNQRQDSCVSSSPSILGSRVFPMDISPLPQLNVEKDQIKKRGRPSCPATVLTSSPYKMKLGEDIAKKRGKNVAKNNFGKALNKNNQPVRKTEKKNKIIPKKGTVRNKRRKIKLDPLSETSSESDEDPDQPLTVSTDDEDSENDCECPFCNQLYSADKGGEKWIICIKCRMWCHELCSGAEDYKTFICDFCLEN